MSEAQPVFSVGDHVTYVGDHKCVQGVAGTILEIYQGHWSHSDLDGDYWSEHHYRVLVDELSKDWPYPDTDVFAPGESEVVRTRCKKRSRC